MPGKNDGERGHKNFIGKLGSQEVQMTNFKGGGKAEIKPVSNNRRGKGRSSNGDKTNQNRRKGETLGLRVLSVRHGGRGEMPLWSSRPT